jgi:murein DD-endopeptidase MepM/ murein hydrolase activator NlpD
MRFPLVLALSSVLLLAGSAGASSNGSQAAATASAFGVKIVSAQGNSISTSVSAPPDAVGYGSGFAYPSDGSVLTTGPLSVSASTDAANNARSTAASSVSSLSLFGGEVTASTVTGNAQASTTGQTATGSLSASTVTGLTVGGVAQAASPNGRVTLGDWGYAITLEQAEVRSAPGTRQSYRGFVTGLDIHVTADHGGLAAGSEILVGYAESWVQAATPSPVVPTPPAKPAKKKPTKPAPKQGQTPSLPSSLHPIPVGLQPQLIAGPYVFPVYGLDSSFTDTFGSFRGDVPGNWHHGDDIFAPLGTPILACAEGTVFSVGWNGVGGNRLWLRDGQGNEFYYAHLSAYSPAARNGNRVKAGEVVGFVGNTGDAEGTPYHLHFEVHPVAYLGLGYDGAVDPTPYLNAWQQQKNLFLAQVAGYARGVAGPAPKPGAILLQSTDISQANGLDPASLRRALLAPLGGGEGGRLGTVDSLFGN